MTRPGLQTRLEDGHNREHGAPTVERYQTYEITFTGQAGPALCALFDDCDIAVGSHTTTLRANLPDQAALAGLLQRISSLRLEILHLELVGGTPRS